MTLGTINTAAEIPPGDIDRWWSEDSSGALVLTQAAAETGCSRTLPSDMYYIVMAHFDFTQENNGSVPIQCIGYIYEATSLVNQCFQSLDRNGSTTSNWRNTLTIAHLGLASTGTEIHLKAEKTQSASTGKLNSARMQIWEVA
jgi:hypothetical protein